MKYWLPSAILMMLVFAAYGILSLQNKAVEEPIIYPSDGYITNVTVSGWANKGKPFMINTEIKLSEDAKAIKVEKVIQEEGPCFLICLFSAPMKIDLYVSEKDAKNPVTKSSNHINLEEDYKHKSINVTVHGSEFEEDYKIFVK